MTDLASIRAAATDHARQLESVHFLTVSDLAARWGVDQKTIRSIDREKLPYLPFGKSNVRRYDPRDVEAFEEREKRGTAA